MEYLALGIVAIVVGIAFAFLGLGDATAYDNKAWRENEKTRKTLVEGIRIPDGVSIREGVKTILERRDSGIRTLESLSKPTTRFHIGGAWDRWHVVCRIGRYLLAVGWLVVLVENYGVAWYLAILACGIAGTVGFKIGAVVLGGKKWASFWVGIFNRK